MSTTTTTKKKLTPAEQTAKQQNTAQSKARAKRWSERRRAQLLLENRPTTQPTQVVAPQDTTQPTQVVAPQEPIPVTVATQVSSWTANPTHIQRLGSPNDSHNVVALFTRRAFYNENLEYIQREIAAIDREIERLVDPRLQTRN